MPSSVFTIVGVAFAVVAWVMFGRPTDKGTVKGTGEMSDSNSSDCNIVYKNCISAEECAGHLRSMGIETPPIAELRTKLDAKQKDGSLGTYIIVFIYFYIPGPSVLAHPPWGTPRV